MCEAAGFDWGKYSLQLPDMPYVVMECLRGETLQAAVDRDYRPWTSGEAKPPPLIPAEKRSILQQAASALEYLAVFGLIHRDFRGCNMLLERRLGDGDCSLKILDLGVMISSEEHQQYNPNLAVQAFRGFGATEEKRRKHDWLPWEIRTAANGHRSNINFLPPAHSFDVFSLGVLALHLIMGKMEARVQLDAIQQGGRLCESDVLGLNLETLHQMLGEAKDRPHPTQVLKALADGAMDERPRLVCNDEELKPVIVHGMLDEAETKPHTAELPEMPADVALDERRRPIVGEEKMVDVAKNEPLAAETEMPAEGALDERLRPIVGDEELNPFTAHQMLDEAESRPDSNGSLVMFETGALDERTRPIVGEED